jgi:carbamoyl-phosphate synthase large subunit
VIASPLETVKIAEDKWLTVEFLRKNGLPYAEAYLAQNGEDALKKAKEWGYPFILKTRTGTASRHVHVIEDEDSLVSLYPKTPRPMLQKMISQPTCQLKSEYTCSVFKCRGGRLLGPFTARRSLRGGSSWHVEVDRFEELEPLLMEIGQKLPVMGSLNVQLMKDDCGTPIPFELNARFSGTTAVRAHFGFNEPEMALKNYFLEEELAQPRIRRGLALRPSSWRGRHR